MSLLRDRHRTMTVLLGLLVVACEGAGPERRTEEHILQWSEETPCRLVFTPTGVSVPSSRGDQVPDAVRNLASAPDGMFYSATEEPGEIAVWARDGSLAERFGSVGQGPGEFGPVVTPVTGPGDEISVFQPDGTWTRFAAGDSVIHRVTSNYLVHSRQDWYRFLPDGAVVTGEASGSEAGPWQFTIVNPDGSLHTRFSRLEPLPPDYFGLVRVRSVAVSPEGRIWAAPWRGSPAGYQLEEWTAAGVRTVTLKRSAPWFPQTVEMPIRGNPDPPRLRVHMDDRGHLLSIVLVPDSEVTYFEVIDPDGPRVLASSRVPFERRPFPHEFVPLTRTGIAREADAFRLVTFHIWEYHLVPTDSAGKADSALCR